MTPRPFPIALVLALLLGLGAGAHAAQQQDTFPQLVQSADAALDRFDLETAEARYTEAVATGVAAGIDLRQIAEIERRLARVQGLRGAADAAIGTLRRSIERIETARGLKDPALVGCLEDLALRLRDRHEPKTALDLLRRALNLVPDEESTADAVRSVTPETEPMAATDLVRLRLLDAFVKIAEGSGDAASTLDGAQRRLAILARVRGADSPDLTLPLKQIAHALRSLGRPKEAIPYIRLWIEIHQKVRGADHPSIAEALEDLVTCQAESGALDDADATLARWTRILRGVADNHPNLVDCDEWGARILTLRGKHAEAADRLESALTLAKRAFWDRPQRLGAIALALARESRTAGRLERARASLEDARKYFATLGDDSAEALHLRLEEARLDLASGEPTRALAMLEATVVQLETRLGKSHRALIEPLEIAAQAYLQLGRGEDAERATQRARSIAGD